MRRKCTEDEAKCPAATICHLDGISQSNLSSSPVSNLPGSIGRAVRIDCHTEVVTLRRHIRVANPLGQGSAFAARHIPAAASSLPGSAFWAVRHTLQVARSGQDFASAAHHSQAGLQVSPCEYKGRQSLTAMVAVVPRCYCTQASHYSESALDAVPLGWLLLLGPVLEPLRVSAAEHQSRTDRYEGSEPGHTGADRSCCGETSAIVHCRLQLHWPRQRHRQRLHIQLLSRPHCGCSTAAHPDRHMDQEAALLGPYSLNRIRDRVP